MHITKKCWFVSVGRVPKFRGTFGVLGRIFLWVCAEEHTIYSELRVERFLLGAFFCQSTQCTCKMGRWAKFVLNPHGT